MKLFNNNGGDIDMNEIIFENRNKAYGAYTIRNAYSGTLTKSLVIVGTFFSSLFILALYYSKLNGGKSIADLPQILTNFKVDTYTIEPPKPEAPKQKAAIQGRADTKEKIVEIKDDVEEKKIEPTKTDTPPDVNGTANGIAGNSGKSPSGDTLGTESTNIDSHETAHNEPTRMPDVFPKLNNLNELLRRNIRYPQMAIEEGMQGTVYLNFIVDEEGNIANINVARGVGAGLTEEALRVVKLLPKWEPGYLNGKKVKVSFTLPIKFALQ